MGDTASSHSSGFFGKFSFSPQAELALSYNIDMLRLVAGRGIGFVVAAILLASITFGYSKLLHVNQTTVALSFLLAILAVSAVWGMVVSVFMSVSAMLLFNYYFLPPIGTFTIADPQNWVALFAFLLTSIMGSQLSARIRKEADAAHSRRREVERLYTFSQKLLGEGNVIQLMNAIPNFLVDCFEAGAAELFLPQKEKYYRSGYGAAQVDEELMKTAFLRDETTSDNVRALYFLPVRLGVKPIGSLGISGAIDRLLVEGQSAQHFARQMLRFLRNVMVAKVAGSDSPVLQISTDERARVARVAERFSEEDLARFMQIMLRTHSDLGYKQEQRFHLELGLLKLVHAQRLLPLEELLSGEAGKTGASGSTSRTGGAGSRSVASPATRPSGTSSPSRDSMSRETESQSSRAPAGSPFARPSPFEADRNRKSEPKAEAPPDFAKQAMISATVPRSSTQAEPEISANVSTTVEGGVATAVALDSEPGLQPAPSTTGEIEVETAREAVLAALEDAQLFLRRGAVVPATTVGPESPSSDTRGRTRGPCQDLSARG